MNYTLNQLKIFLKVCELRSITKAAEELHLTQPAVSIQLRNFQDQFEIPLIEVVGRKIFITDFGMEVSRAAEKILNEVNLIHHKILAYQGHLSGRLKISTVSTGKYIMPYFLTDFLKLNPGVELLLDVTNKQKVIESLEQNEVDFSLVSVLPERLNINNFELMQNKLYLVGNGADVIKPIANKKQFFANLPLIYREKGSGTRFIMERFVERNEIPIVKKLELTSNEAVKQAVIAGIGYSIMPLAGIKNELFSKQLQIIPVSGFPIKSMWNLIWNHGKVFSPVASAYLEYVKKEKKKIVERYFEWNESFYFGA